jgi:hypothetical protein
MYRADDASVAELIEGAGIDIDGSRHLFERTHDCGRNVHCLQPRESRRQGHGQTLELLELVIRP